MSDEKVISDNSVQIWELQNSLLLEWGIDIVNRTFSLPSVIDETSFTELDAKLSLLEREPGKTGDRAPITIRLNNSGGDVHAAWAMTSRIIQSPCQIIIEAHGHIMSAATMIFAAADIRKASKYCTFMFHEASLGVEGKKNELKNTLNYFEKEEIMYCTFLADRSKRTSKYWKKVLQSNKDVYLNASEVKNLGLVEEIF